MNPNIFQLAAMALALSACGQGGRALTETGPRSENAPPAEGSQEPDILIDPVGQLLEPTGLGYRVDTWLETADGTIHQTGYGVDLLPVGMDVDDNTSTGSVGGADISVHLITLLLYARLQIDVLSGAPETLPLKVEVTLLDPRNLLGLPGLLGVVDPDLRIALGMDAREADAPMQFSSELLVLDSLFDFLPRFTSVQYTVTTSGETEAVAATLSTFADRSGIREDSMEIETAWRPAVSEALVDVVLAPDAAESSVMLNVSEPSAMKVALRSTNGLADEPTSYRNLDVRLNELQQSFNLLLTGVDGFDGVDGVDTRYELSTDAAIDRVELNIEDGDSSGIRYARAVLGPLPTEVAIVQSVSDELSISTSETISDISFAQATNTPVVWSTDTDPDEPFREHVLRFSERADGTDLLQARLAGLKSLVAKTEPDLELDGELQAAPLQYREDTDTSFVDARLERLPGRFSIRFPDDNEVLRFSYEADAAGPSLHYEKQDLTETTVADIRPLPASFNLCASSDDTCGSHGARTAASIHFTASETMQVNYLQRSTDGNKEIAIRDLRLSELALDAGVSSSGSKGYIYVDTAGEAFHGTFLQRDGDSGLYLLFSEGTHAESRRVRYKNFIQIDERSGTMQCPGRENLEVRAGGVWYDFDFVLNQLCQ